MPVLIYGDLLALQVFQSPSLGLLTDDEKIYELIQGRVLFRGRSGPKDAWTAEEDQIAQMIELFGPIPASLRKRGKFSNKYFDEDGESSAWRVIFN
jgi:serine/threonine-protein kinase SRPK3